MGNTLRVELYCLMSTSSGLNCINVNCTWVWVISGMIILTVWWGWWWHETIGLGPVMCVIVTSDNEQQSKHSRRRGLRWDEIDFMLFLCFSGGCSVHQLSWVDEIIFAVCLYLTWHKPDIDTDIRIMAPGIIGAISFNAGPWLQITNTEIISGPASGQCPDTPDVRPPMSLVSTHRVWVWCQWEPGELLPEREPAHYALRRARPGLRNAGLQVVTRPVHWRLETSHNQWSVKREPGEQWEQCVEWEHSVTRGTRDMWA